MKRLVTLFLLLALLCPVLAFAQGRTKLEVLAGGDPALAVLSADLLRARQAVERGKLAETVIGDKLSHAVRDGKLECVIAVSELSDNLLEACQAAGLEVVKTSSFAGVNHVTVRAKDPRQLVPLARRSDVRQITPAYRARTWTGSVTSQADESIKAFNARAIYGVDGSGVRVGVLSDSVYDVVGGNLAGGILTDSSPQLTLDLPAEVRVIDPGPGGGSDEGAAMMELIHDLAPGSDLSFASAFTGYTQFAQNIINLVNDPGYECQIIVDDVIYFAEPVYQDGPIAAAYEVAYASGVACFSSAGNNADKAHERFFVDIDLVSDSTDYPPIGVDFHDFGGAIGQATPHTHLEIMLEPDDVLIAVLHWDEPYGGGGAPGPGSEVDLDLYLVSDTNLPITDPGNLLEEAANSQGSQGSPSGDSYEYLEYQNVSGSTETVYLVIDHYHGRKDDLLLHLWVNIDGNGEIVDRHLLGDRTIYGHAAAENVMAVAAMFYREIDTGGTATPPSGELNVQPYSSLGGDLPFFFAENGSVLTPEQYRFKPDITGPDGTDTTFFGSNDFDGTGFPNFFGTSAAAPHVAAVAALLMDASPDLTVDDIYDVLRGTAVDAESPGPDYLAGHGIVDASAAVGSISVTPVGDWKKY